MVVKGIYITWLQTHYDYGSLCACASLPKIILTYWCAVKGTPLMYNERVHINIKSNYQMSLWGYRSSLPWPLAYSYPIYLFISYTRRPTYTNFHSYTRIIRISFTFLLKLIIFHSYTLRNLMDMQHTTNKTNMEKVEITHFSFIYNDIIYINI